MKRGIQKMEESIFSVTGSVIIIAYLLLDDSSTSTGGGQKDKDES